ncbi:MAG: N-acetyltransferase [Candidatus Aenigmatarchaeota archaeon]
MRIIEQKDYIRLIEPKDCSSLRQVLRRYEIVLGKNFKIRDAIIYHNVEIGDNFETGHNVVIRENNHIGDNVCIWSNTVIDYECSIGNNVKIHCNCYIAQRSVIKDRVFIAPGVVFSNDYHPGCSKYRTCMKGPIIEEDVKIGCNVTILPRVVIHRNSLIAAGSVVTKDVDANSVVLGNPARFYKSIFDLTCKTGITDKPYK